jgi:hypothetical protein
VLRGVVGIGFDATCRVRATRRNERLGSNRKEEEEEGTLSFHIVTMLSVFPARYGVKTPKILGRITVIPTAESVSVRPLLGQDVDFTMLSSHSCAAMTSATD